MSTDLITTGNGKFMRNGIAFRFFGANMYELAYVDTDTAARMLEAAARQGFNAVRFWAFASVNKKNFSSICEISAALGLCLIPVFGDMNEYLQGFKADDNWFRHGYKAQYLESILRIVSDFRDCREILIWEIFNEPSADKFEVIRDFADDVSSRVKSIDPVHAVSIGTIGGVGDRFGNEFSRLDAGNFRKLYSLPGLDAVSLHDYSYCARLLERADIYYRLKGRTGIAGALSKIENVIHYIPDLFNRFLLKKAGLHVEFPISLRSLWKHYNRIDLLIAKELGKPVYIGEIGIKRIYGDLRKKILMNELSEYGKAGVSGAVLWSFETQGRSLDGHDYGFDENDDFGSLANIFTDDPEK